MGGRAESAWAKMEMCQWNKGRIGKDSFEDGGLE